MSAKGIVIGVVSVVSVLGFLGNIGSTESSSSAEINTKTTSSSTPGVKSYTPAKINKISDKTVPTCDGTVVTSSCTSEGVNYKTYIYHPAVAEKTHTVQETSYRQEVSGYCTLCNDGTYSPSCATGRGACSYHGGVAQWNAPRYTNVPVTTSKTIVDAQAVAEYYEKIVE